MTATIPPFVLKLIAEEAARDIACGPTAAEDLPIATIREAFEGLGEKRKISEMTIVSEIFHQNSDGRLLFTFERMGRYARKLETTFGVNAGDTTICGASFNAIARLMGKIRKEDESSGVEPGASPRRSIRLVSWGVHQQKGKATILTLAYYINTACVDTSGLAERGAAVSVVFDDAQLTDLAKAEASRAEASAHKEHLGVFDSVLVATDGSVYDGAASRLLCVAEGSVVVPLNYTPSSAIEEVLGMDVALLGLKGLCDQMEVDFRTVELSIGHLAMADCFALFSDSHDIVPVAAVIVPLADKEKINASFLPAFIEHDGFLILRKVVTPVHTALIDKINRHVNSTGYQWGDDLSSGCPQQ